MIGMGQSVPKQITATKPTQYLEFIHNLCKYTLISMSRLTKIIYSFKFINIKLTGKKTFLVKQQNKEYGIVSRFNNSNIEKTKGNILHTKKNI